MPATRPARKDDLPVIPFPSATDWQVWLAEHHASSPGLWLKLAKKGSGIASVTYAEAVDVALRFGWIDGQSRSYDDNFWLQRFTRRASRSKWSKNNCARVTELIEAGEMTPAGMAEVERAKADGRWDTAYDAPSSATVPEDFSRRLDNDRAAREFFATLDSRNRYAILHRIQDAKKPDTRARRIEKYVEMLHNRERIYQ